MVKLNFMFISISIVISCFLKINAAKNDISTNCTQYTNETKIALKEESRKQSLIDKNLYIVDIFSNKIDNFDIFKKFSEQVNNFFGQVVKMNFYCKNMESKPDLKDTHMIYMYKDGKVKKEKNIKYLSTNFLDKFFKNFNLTKSLEKKTKQISIQFSDIKKTASAFISSNQNFNSKIRHLEEFGEEIHNMANDDSKSYSNVLLQLESISKNLEDSDEDKDELIQTAKNDITVNANSPVLTPNFLQIETKTTNEKVPTEEQPETNPGFLQVEKKNKYDIQFTQFSFEDNDKKNKDKFFDDMEESFADVTSNRGLRLFLVIFTVLVLTGLCVVGVKFSIDLATSHKTELNKLKEAQLRQVVEEDPIMQKYLQI